MAQSARLGGVRVLVILSIATLARCALLDMSRTLWSKAVSGCLTKVGKLDPLRVPLIKVDQSEGDTSYRMVLRNLEIVGLNESTLESIHIARGGLKSNLSEHEAGYVSYSDLRDADSIRYRFHTVAEQTSAPREAFDARISAASRAQADVKTVTRYQEDRFSGSARQDQRGFRMFERNRQYDRPTMPPRPITTTFAEPGDFYRSGSRTSSYTETSSGYFDKRPAHVQPVYAQKAMHFHRTDNSQNDEDAVEDCEDVQSTQQFSGQKGNRPYEPRQDAADRKYYRVDDIEVNMPKQVSASQTIEARLKNRDFVRAPVSYNRGQQRMSFEASADAKLPKDGTRERARSSYIDIIYADDKANGSAKHFGNLGIDPRENRRVYGIDDVMKEIRESSRFIVHNFTEGEALTKRNDMMRAAMEARRLKNMSRYAKGHQEQQGYFEEGMQVIYHYGEIDASNGSAVRNVRLNDTRRAKRAHSEDADSEDDVMHVILRIRVPLLRVKSQYTLAGKVQKQALRGNGLFAGNFTDLVGDFALELKKVNEDLIVRTATAKLSARDKKITLQGMDEDGPARVILNHGLMAAEAVAAMLADDLATKGLSEKTADAVIYRMYKDLPTN